MPRTTDQESLLSDLSTQAPAPKADPHTGTYRTHQMVWVESFGVSLAGFYLSKASTVQMDGHHMLRVRLVRGADPFGRYAGIVTVAWQQVRPRYVPWRRKDTP